MSPLSWHTPLPPSSWPITARKAWADACRRGDFLDPGGRSSSWRQASKVMAEIGFGLWLSWLSVQNFLSKNMGVTSHLNKDNIESFARDLHKDGNSEITVAIRVGALALMMFAIAPDDDWEWIYQIEKRIRLHATPVRNKVGRIRQTEELFGLGLNLMAQAQELGETTESTSPAVLYRDGLAISLLALRPLRLQNFTNIVIGQHLIREDGVWFLKFTNQETKTHRPINVPVPQTITDQLECYLARYRLALVRGECSNHALWISNKNAQPLTCSGMKQVITQRTKSAFGHSINPHLFRDCAATSLALIDPEYVWMAPILLGHSSLDTTEKHYIQARTCEATDLINSDLFDDSQSERSPKKSIQQMAAAHYLTQRARRG